MNKLSLITETFTESVIREMTRICDAANGINLSPGFPDFDTPEELKALAITAISSGRNQYQMRFAFCKKLETLQQALRSLKEAGLGSCD